MAARGGRRARPGRLRRSREGGPDVRRTIVLDADGLSKLARGDRRVREMMRQEVVEARSALVIPVIVTAQAFAGTSADQAVREILGAAHEVAPVDPERAAQAAQLMRATGLRDVVDALVATEALRRVPAIVVTSDPGHLRRLLDADPAGPRVAVWRV